MTDWTLAACAGLDTNWWFRTGHHDTGRKRDQQDLADDATAKRVCQGCPIQQACLEAALALEGNTGASGRHGVFGGLTPAQRGALAGSPPVTVPRDLQPCGTSAAYTRHVRRGERACLPCREANRQASRVSQAKMRAKARAAA